MAAMVSGSLWRQLGRRCSDLREKFVWKWSHLYLGLQSGGTNCASKCPLVIPRTSKSEFGQSYCLLKRIFGFSIIPGVSEWQFSFVSRLFQSYFYIPTVLSAFWVIFDFFFTFQCFLKEIWDSVLFSALLESNYAFLQQFPRVSECFLRFPTQILAFFLFSELF